MAAWLTALQEQLATLREHEHSPLFEVQRRSAVPGGTPLFESLVVFENYPVEEALREEARALSVADTKVVEWTHYPLTLQAAFRRTLTMHVSYSLRRFDERGDRAACSGHLRALLDGIVAGPGRAASASCRCCGRRARASCVVGVERDRAPVPRGRAASTTLFEAQADARRRTPSR